MAIPMSTNTNQIKVPSLPKEIELNQNMFISFNTDQSPAPLSTTDVLVTENKNSTPYAIRSSMYVVPNENCMLENVSLPFGIVLTPFDLRVSPFEIAMFKDHSAGVLNKSGDGYACDGILRCAECFSFANPWCKVENNYFVCNLCGFKNVFQNLELRTHEFFRYPTIEIGRLNTQGRTPEVANSDEDMVTGNFYHSVTRNDCAILIFALEFTGKSVNSGLFSLALKAIKENIENMGYFYGRAALLLYDNTLRAFHLKNGNVRIDNYFSDDVIVGDFLAFGIDQVGKVLEKLETMMSENTLRPTSNEVSLELVLKYSLYISKYFVGTKTILFTQQKKNLNFAGQNVGSSPENLVGRFIEARNSLFVFEIRNEIENPLEFLVNRTNGNIFDISQIDPKFSLILQRRAVFGVKMELKTSDSIRKSRVYGNTICDSFTPSFAQMDDESTVSYTFFIDEFMRDGQSVFLQAIVTYWTHSGEKRILVLNQRLVASAKYSTVYDFMAFDTVFAIIFRSIASRNASSQGRHIADWNKKIVNSLLFFRKKCSADSRPTELVLPESLKSLPNLFQALTKNRLLNITATNQNSNLLYLQRLSNKPVSKNLYYVYPRLIAFSDFFIDRNIKKCLQLSKKGLVDGEIYVMDNSEVIYIFLTKGVDEELVRMLFESVQQNYNTRSLGFRAQNAVLGNNTNPGNLILAEKDNEENRILNLLIEKINDSHRDVLDVKIVRQGNDVDVMGYFVEDDLNGVKAYSEFLCDIHFKIRGVK